MLASEGEKLGRHEQHLIKTIRHMENLFEIVHDLSAITKITDLMGAIEHRVSKLLSVCNPFKKTFHHSKITNRKCSAIASHYLW